MLVRLALALAVNAAALWVADALLDGVQIHGFWAYLIASVVLAVANAVVKPVLTLLTLPLVIVTLGLFLLVVNTGMVAPAEWIASAFSIDGFWASVGTVFILWLVTLAVNALLERRSRSPVY